jgi:hypothetical protein
MEDGDVVGDAVGGEPRAGSPVRSLPPGARGRDRTLRGLQDREAEMRFTSKRELVESLEEEHRTFVALAGSVPRTRHKEGGVWGDGWTIHDLFAHLMEWEQMFLRWYREGLEGLEPALPAPGFKWNETPRLNRAIWKKHRDRSGEKVRAEFDASYEEVLSTVRLLSEEELFTPGHFKWTKRSRLVSYLGANTTSHYRTATKILRRWLRGVRRPTDGPPAARRGSVRDPAQPGDPVPGGHRPRRGRRPRARRASVR